MFSSAQEFIEYITRRRSEKSHKENFFKLIDELGHPEQALKVIHVAGTNGKGSVTNYLRSILQSHGYKVGTFTSPHLTVHNDRIRINDENISDEDLLYWGNYFEKEIRELDLGMFQVDTLISIFYFLDKKVDYVVYEVGMGGRLDCTNIVTPLLSVITNISLDHVHMLGNTLAEIASEKAGIIKTGMPVVVGEAEKKEVRDVFETTAQQCHSPIVIAQDSPLVTDASHNTNGTLQLSTANYGFLTCQLAGDYQVKNANTVLHAIEALKASGIKISKRAVVDAFAHVCQYTGFMARWMVVGSKPTVIFDAGHNAGAWKIQSKQLAGLKCDRLHMVLGFSADKDIDTVLGMMPKQAIYYFTQAQSARSMKAEHLQLLATKHELKGDSYSKVIDAYKAAKKSAKPSDCIFVGGSFYVLGELFKQIKI